MEHRGCGIHCDTDGISPRWEYAGGRVLPAGKTFGSASSEEGCRRAIDHAIQAATLADLDRLYARIDAIQGADGERDAALADIEVIRARIRLTT